MSIFRASCGYFVFCIIVLCNHANVQTLPNEEKVDQWEQNSSFPFYSNHEP
jgi:hypothetical protein